jgi:hypothetical protein
VSEWWSYSLSDFLLFSPRAYYRLFELHNAALWPAHLVAAMLGVGILVLLRRRSPSASRAIILCLALCWLFVAYAFLWRRYLSINWAAIHAVVAFAAEGVLLALLGIIGRPPTFHFARDARTGIAVALFAFALVIYPAMAPAFGRPLAQGELFGLAPDPTAIGTLAVLLLAEVRRRWLLLIVPVTWCLGSGVTLWAMRSTDAWIPPMTALALVIAAWRFRARAFEAPPL